MRTLPLVALLLAVPAIAQEKSIFPTPAEKAAARRFEPENVSAESRAFLKLKMKNHNKDLRELSIAVATVELAEVQRLAQIIANQPRLDPAGGPAARLPPRFFELQDALRTTAQELADAGKANELEASVKAYERLVGHCVACHASFKKR